MTMHSVGGGRSEVKPFYIKKTGVRLLTPGCRQYLLNETAFPKIRSSPFKRIPVFRNTLALSKNTFVAQSMHHQKCLPLLVGRTPGAVGVLAIDNMNQCIVELGIDLGNIQMSQGVNSLGKGNIRAPVAPCGLPSGKPGNG